MAFAINMQVINAFGLNPKKITREKAYFLCDTADGLIKIQKTTASPARITFQHAVKEHTAAGYPWTDRYRLTAAGLPYVSVGGETYTAAHAVRGREVELTDWADMARVLSATARWHLSARHLPLPAEARPPAPVPLTEYFAKQDAALSAMAKQVRRQARLSDFDVLFIKNNAFYSQQVKSALQALAESDYLRWYERAQAHGHVCHRLLKEENLPLYNERVYITQYEEAAVDTQLTDIAALIRRYVQRAGQQAAPIGRLLETLDRVEPLPSGALRILQALLQFPWHFMKITAQYYSKKRSWTPVAIISRMETAVAEAELYNAYVAGLTRRGCGNAI